MPRRIDGNHALYHYIQKVILPREDGFSRELVERLVLDLSIWLPPEFCAAVPVLFPYCVRTGGLKAREWGTPDSSGRLRDNNSILKRVVGSYAIRSPLTPVYPRSGRGRNFIACHIWRKAAWRGERVQTPSHPQLYSFIPNLAWLPAQVAKLTDHEGSHAQRLLQSVSRKLYQPVAEQFPEVFREIWEGCGEVEDCGADVGRLNFFAVSERSVRMRRRIVREEVEAVLAVLVGGTPRAKPVRSARYLSGLSQADRGQTGELRAWLEAYRVFLDGNGAG